MKFPRPAALLLPTPAQEPAPAGPKDAIRNGSAGRTLQAPNLWSGVDKDGFPAGFRRKEAGAHELLPPVFHKDIVLRSGREWGLPYHPADFSPLGIHARSDTALRWLADGRITTDGPATRANPRDAQRAHQNPLHRRAEGLFKVFDWPQMESDKAKNGQPEDAGDPQSPAPGLHPWRSAKTGRAEAQ